MHSMIKKLSCSMDIHKFIMTRLEVDSEKIVPVFHCEKCGLERQGKIMSSPNLKRIPNHLQV